MEKCSKATVKNCDIQTDGRTWRGQTDMANSRTWLRRTWLETEGHGQMNLSNDADQDGHGEIEMDMARSTLLVVLINDMA